MQRKSKIFITLFVTYAFFTNTYLTTNDGSRFSLTVAIVEDQTLQIDNFLDNIISDWWWPKDFAFYEGRKYSDKAPLGSILGIPPYLIARLFTKDFGIRAYFVSLFTAGILTAATSLLIYETGLIFGTDKTFSTILALTFGIGTIAFFYGTVFFSHSITSFFGFASFYLLLKIKKGLGGGKSLIISGAFAGLAISSDYFAGIISFVLLIYALHICGGKTYKFLLALLTVLLLLMMYHWAAFGNPFTVPYLHANLYSDYHMEGFYGLRFIDSILISNLLDQLFAPWGFFFTTPLIIFSIFALPSFSKRYRQESASILFISAGHLLLAGSIGMFDAYSSRFLVPIVTFLFLPMFSIDYKNQKTKLALYFIIFISVFINIAGVDTFLPNIADPNYIRATRGNHNILGEFLLNRGISLGFLTILPLALIYVIIWKNEIIRIYRNLRIL